MVALRFQLQANVQLGYAAMSVKIISSRDHHRLMNAGGCELIVKMDSPISRVNTVLKTTLPDT